MADYQKKKQAYRAIILLLLLSSLLLIPHNLNAQSQGTHVTYLDSIALDEEGKKLLLPFFVLTEPVMKEIYVIDGRSRVIIYTSDFFPLYTFDKKNGIESPLGLAVDADGNVYIAQAPSKKNPRPRISVFNASFKWEKDIYLEGFEGADEFAPYRLAIDKKGNIYVAESYFPGVLILDNKGNLIDILSPEEEGEKVNLANVTLDKSGRIYVVSEEASRIYVYDENRELLFKFGEKGGSSGKLSRPRAVGVDERNGRIYVIDYMRHTATAYSYRDGRFLFEFGGMGWSEGWFQFPNDLTVDSTGRILIADFFNHRIQVFNAP